MVAVSTKSLVRLITLLAIGTTAYAGAQPWPLKGEIDLSSGYGDYRSGGRFHSGLDLRTGGQVGVKVYSPVDGYVWRIRMSYGGYGKGLYLMGNDGYIYVFGHLSGFNEKIQAVVTEAQFRRERYFVDLQFKADSIPVKAGQLIAYTGQSGAGGPHLHFEKRTADNVPLNPLSHGFTLDDKTPPTFERVGLHVLDDRSLFADGHRKTYLPVRRIGPGNFELARDVKLSAPFGILVDCFDQMRPGGRRQAVYGLTLSIDDSLYYVSTLDSLSYDVGPIVDLLYEPVEAAKGDQRVRRAYRPVPADQVWSQARNSYGGATSGQCAYGLTLPPEVGEHQVVITAEDAFGNRSRLTFQFDYVEPGTAGSLSQACDYSEAGGAFRGDISDWWLEEDGLVTRVGAGRHSHDFFFRPLPPAEADQGEVSQLFDRYASVLAQRGVELQTSGWGRGRLINADGSALSIVIPPGTFFAPQFVAASAVDIGKVPGAEVVLSGYRIIPEAAASRERLQVSINIAEGYQKVRQAGLYRREHHNGSWIWVGGITGDSSAVTGTSAGGGIFAALADTAAPIISGLNLRHHHKYYNRKPEVRFRLSDNLSGFEDDRSIDVRIDDHWLLPEFDFEEGDLVATLREPLSLGPHRLNIRVVDRAGNRSEMKIDFEIVKRGKK